MTAAELVAILTALPPEAEVFIRIDAFCSKPVQRVAIGHEKDNVHWVELRG